MAIVIRFNVIIVRKSSIEIKYPGGLEAYRKLYLPRKAQYYCEDRHLISHTSMGAFYNEYDPLLTNGLASHEDGVSAESCGANGADGIDPRCSWLKVRVLEGGLVCWFADSPPGFVTDSKLHWFVQRVSETHCAQCKIIFGLEASARAVDFEERRLGPLKIVRADPFGLDLSYVVWCPSCNEETVFSGDGRLSATSR